MALPNMTNVIFTFHVREGETNILGVEAIDNWLKAQKKPRLWRVEKHLNQEGLRTFMFIGSYSNLDLDGLIKTIVAAPWVNPESVQLLTKAPGEDFFKEVTV